MIIRLMSQCPSLFPQRCLVPDRNLPDKPVRQRASQRLPMNAVIARGRSGDKPRGSATVECLPDIFCKLPCHFSHFDFKSKVRAISIAQRHGEIHSGRSGPLLEAARGIACRPPGGPKCQPIGHAENTLVLPHDRAIKCHCKMFHRGETKNEAI